MSEKMKKLLALLLFFCLTAVVSADEYADQHKEAKETGLVWVVMVGEDW